MLKMKKEMFYVQYLFRLTEKNVTKTLFAALVQSKLKVPRKSLIQLHKIDLKFL